MKVDVLIAGAGPAGLAAAVELRRSGAGRVLVLDRETTPGGVPRHCLHTGYGLRDLRRLLDGPAYARRYADAAAAAGADVQAGSTVTGWTGDRTVTVTSARGVESVEAAAVLLATGCRERPRTARLVPGGRPPGVMTTGELQQRVYLGGQRCQAGPGRTARRSAPRRRPGRPAAARRRGRGDCRGPPGMNLAERDPAGPRAPRGRFVMRSRVFRRLARIEIRQDGRLLARSRPASLVPGRPVHLAAGWVSQVDPAGGPVHVALAPGRHSAGGLAPDNLAPDNLALDNITPDSLGRWRMEA